MNLPKFSKSFVSLFFTGNRLQVLQLNADKTGVEKFTSVDLPPGVIVNYKVKDRKALAVILKDIWQTLSLKEKSVGIVVPEFSTFTKSLILPQLKNQELDEAVRWQIQDFLPPANGKMVMDWKVVRKLKDNLQILSVAMQEELLLGFVDAASEAGFSPLVVETPSLSLARISDKDLSAKLIIYASFGEAILALAKGEEILGSSVLASSDAASILWTVKQMVKHFHNIEVKRIEVGGLQLGQELIDSLKQTFSIPIHLIEKEINGLSNEQVQEYLVPLSLQFKDPAEPADETTINLLPIKWASYYQNRKKKLQTWSLLITASVIIWTCLLLTLGVYLVLTKQMEVLQKDNVEQILSLPKEISSQVEQINKIVDKVTKITSLAKSPQEVVKIIVKAKPKGVFLSEYQIDLDSGKILLKGQAVSRQSFIDFKKALSASEKFSKVQIPLSAFETKENLEFEIRLVYETATKKKAPIKIPIK